MPKIKTKEPVRIRKKMLNNGNESLYLDIYVDGNRTYEFLKLYLVPEKSRADKVRNSETLRLAEAVRAQRVVDIQNNKFGFTARKRDVPFIGYLDGFLEKKKDSATLNTMRSWASAEFMMRRYFPPRMTLSQITEVECVNYAKYLRNTAARNGAKKLGDTTSALYFMKFKSVLAQAVKDGLIPSNPCANVKLERKDSKERVYLLKDEIAAMARTECKHEEIKRAFLFSCLTGIRWSDIQKMTWREVQQSENGMRIVFMQKKTRFLEYLDINSQAASLLGERGENGERVFPALKYNPTVTSALRKWAKDAGVDKEITFHSGRHTFAVMMIDLGIDLYTVQKLLGHKNIATTQIYADILDKRKVDAVNKIPDLL